MRAGKLVGGLKDESIRWALAIKVLEKELVNLMGNTILAAGYISYVGTFTQSYRNSMLKKWMGFMKEKGIPFAYDFTATTGLPLTSSQLKTVS
jgi:dynein heavy chain